MEYADGKKAAFSCGMALATDQDRHIDRFEIQGTKGSIKGTVITIPAEVKHWHGAKKDNKK